ncbi:MAG: autotransporter assembly complex protein TamA [Shewanella sp.]|nr:autotransporter assembly complex protein TamA [Shewanella sp.]MCF1431510.1 autotransporter assembly complex protein TamA [Shewanella sp.]MCF1437919.1 autotransporter assembly complex protein TamA [Shewanella sp.]MCF1456322.1 autotransporter assembly complex protein TamA [Shewanella sp.]
MLSTSNRPAYLLLLLVLLLPLTVQAKSKTDPLLALTISGVDEALSRNISAHLGSLPETEAQRRAFLFSVQDNVTAALESMGYYHGEIERHLERTDKAPWLLSINVTPGPAVRLLWVDIQVDGQLRNSPEFEKWISSIRMLPGDILNQGVYEDAKSQLQALALAQGYFNARYVTSRITVNRDLNQATVMLHLNSGSRYHFGAIHFEGSDLRSSLLEQLIPFQPHAPYSTQHVGNLNRELLDTGYFSNIKVLPLIEQAKNTQVPVSVQLTPKPANTIDLGVGMELGNTSDNKPEPKASITWRTPQVNSLGHSQKTTIEWSRDSLAQDNYRFQSTYTIPLSHPLDDKLQIKLGLVKESYGVVQVYDPKASNFDTTGQLESTKSFVELLRQQKIVNNWLLGYSVQGLRESYTQSEEHYDPSYVLFGAGIQKTVRGDNSLDPKSGHRSTYTFQYGDPNLGSEIRLTKLQASYLWVDTFLTKHRFVTRLDLGINLVPDAYLALVPPSLRFFAGGDNSIRGYGYQELGPTIDTVTPKGILREVIGGRYLAVGSLEYQYYLTPSWRIAAFIDAGNAFDKNKFKPVVSVGPGIHWISPVGPIKLDIGFGLNKTETHDRSWRIHLTMGTVL